MKDEYTFDNPQSDEWEQVLRSPSIWYRKRGSRFGNIHYSERELVSWLQSNWGGELISCTCLFENQKHLSTQVPMHRVYYTDNPELTEINGALRNTKIVYTDQFRDIKRLQDIVVEMINREK